MQEDTYSGTYGDPMSLNGYAFCANDPINNIDPSGHAYTSWDKAHGVNNSVIDKATAAYKNATTQKQKDDAHVMAGNERNKHRKNNEVGTKSGETIVVDDPKLVSAWKDLTKTGKADLFLQLSLAATKDKNGIYHISQNWWQKYAGYNDGYDWVFNQTTEMDRAKFPFKYNGEQFILWAWKGDYVNLGAGAELGIYYGGGPQWKTGTDYTITMKMRLLLNGKKIIDWKPNKPNWWITGFDPSHQSERVENLKVYTLDFSKRKDMFDAFYKTWNGITNNHWTWEFNKEKHTATLTF